jgi:antitoxin CptB
MSEDEATEQQPLDNRRRRLVFRAQHMGTHENDLLVGDFVKAEIVAMTSGEMDEVEALLKHNDTELADWLTGRLPIPPHADSSMLRRIRHAALNRRVP